MSAATFEPISERYRREWTELKDSRKVRGYDQRSEERRSRDFVDPEDIDVDVETTEDEDGQRTTTRTVTGTVGGTDDNSNGYSFDPATGTTHEDDGDDTTPGEGDDDGEPGDGEE